MFDMTLSDIIISKQCFFHVKGQMKCVVWNFLRQTNIVNRVANYWKKKDFDFSDVH